MDLSVHLPSPRHAGELLETALDSCKRHVERETCGNARQRIADHMPARHLQPQGSKFCAMSDHGKCRAATVHCDMSGMNIKPGG
ncbi:hypothetical protein ABK046_47720, partial [Streptomyces caeruleatus]